MLEILIALHDNFQTSKARTDSGKIYFVAKRDTEAKEPISIERLTI